MPRRKREIGPENLRDLERSVMLRIIDTRWMDHLQEMDYLKEGIGLRAMGQRDPIIEYKNEAYDMFAGLVEAINEDFLRTIMHIQVVIEPEPEPSPALRNVNYSAPTESSIFAGAAEAAAAAGVSRPISRPDRVCGSGRRWRQGGPDGQGQGRPVRERGSQRSVPLRHRQEVQEVPRGERVACAHDRESYPRHRGAARSG